MVAPGVVFAPGLFAPGFVPTVAFGFAPMVAGAAGSGAGVTGVAGAVAGSRVAGCGGAAWARAGGAAIRLVASR